MENCSGESRVLRSNQMKLPNGEHAVVDGRKLHEYCLNPQHLRGRNKARVFAAAGIRQADAEEIRTALLAAASTGKPGRVSRIRTDSATSSTSTWSDRTEQ